ncbi:ATP-dependent DNA helicase RecG [Anthocerotibacter panamensis]|uniref:ATP-dependent DNA helicase RecG n=1 Tax=Anthocerotibacter panamensis TaxID=2857077 RepID=UPI001C405236|nr:ATP-dependent DNA helicase RecG [Anthocerotibacter panamensis]
MDDEWRTRITQALRVEAEKGFPNLQGNRYRFAEFLALTFSEPAPPHLPAQERNLWSLLPTLYRRYDYLPPEERAHLVHRTRHLIEPAPAPKTPPKKNRSMPVGLADPLTALAGIGPKFALQLERLGLKTVGDALRYYPRDYVDYSRRTTIKQIKEGESVTLMGKVRRVNCFTSPRNKKLTILDLTVGDGSGQMKVSQFFRGQQFAHIGWQQKLKQGYPIGATVALSGLVKTSKYGLTLDKPEIEVLALDGDIHSNTIGRIVPIYPLAEGVSVTVVREAIRACLPAAHALQDYFPQSWLTRLDLPSLPQALLDIHFPEDSAHGDRARRRIVFEEFFFLQLGLLLRREERRRVERGQAVPFQTQGALIEQFYHMLPFQLTRAQQRVIAEVLDDLSAPKPMNRLVQGDVGSGKTVVAVAAILAALQSGYQAAFMAPTEVLAEQHYRKLVAWFALMHQPVELLTGSTRSGPRREMLRQLATGELSVLVGTHALIQQTVQFYNLGLVVIDEQHRFGVGQRAQLQHKGRNPDLLTMTATPIPRTLALTLYGDLDVSEIDELPPGRQPIQTTILTPQQRAQAYQFCAREIAQGRQVYVVLPLVEESEKVDLRSALEEHHRLQHEVFPQLRVGLLHGKMKSAEKDLVLTQFRQHQLDILVSTTVIEVGVDVPNATVMLIEHAERFGLAQLHQLRGRVGRGAAQSYCLLMHYTQSEAAQQRLQVLVNFQDGFAIAEMDLRLRGPGAVLGTRQSGLPDLALSSLSTDQQTLTLARQEAQHLLQRDPALKDHPLLHQEVQRRLEKQLGAQVLN